MFPLPLYTVWPYTPAIPAFYWNAKSTDEIIKHMACEYDHITAYFDTLATAINKLSADMQTFENRVEARVSAMEKTLAALLDNLEHVGDKMMIYDPTQGTYVDSKIAMRNMYRELAVFGARVNQMARLSAPMAAAHTCLEFAVLGNKTIFHNDEPRITPRDVHVDDGEPVNPLTVENLANGIVDNNFMKTAK